MGLKDKLKDMSEDEQLKLLATDGMLVKRPLVIGDDFVLTGFKEKRMDRGYARVMCIVSPFYSNLIVVFVSEAL